MSKRLARVRGGPLHLAGPGSDPTHGAFGVPQMNCDIGSAFGCIDRWVCDTRYKRDNACLQQ